MVNKEYCQIVFVYLQCSCAKEISLWNGNTYHDVCKWFIPSVFIKVYYMFMYIFMNPFKGKKLLCKHWVRRECVSISNKLQNLRIRSQALVLDTKVWTLNTCFTALFRNPEYWNISQSPAYAFFAKTSRVLLLRSFQDQFEIWKRHLFTDYLKW